MRFVDRCRGVVLEDAGDAPGDFVVRRTDGVHAYQLAVVVDDGLMQITDVLRGNDLLASTTRQIWLHRQLGFGPPRFAHVPLLVDGAGQRLSKRHASLSIAALRASGMPPTEIIGRLAALGGLLPAAQPVHPEELVGRLDLTRLEQTAIVVDLAELDA